MKSQLHYMRIQCRSSTQRRCVVPKGRSEIKQGRLSGHHLYENGRRDYPEDEDHQ
jgi:hypothetical protein